MIIRILLIGIAALAFAQAAKVALEAAGTPAGRAMAGALGRAGRLAASVFVRILAGLLGVAAGLLAELVAWGAYGIGGLVGAWRGWRAERAFHRTAVSLLNAIGKDGRK